VQTLFNHIQDFCTIKDCCLFCGHKLKLQLSNFMGHSGGVPSLSIPCVDDTFEVSINYSGKQINLEADGFLGVKTNKIFFKIRDKTTFFYNDPHGKSASNFEKLCLHMALKCNNEACTNNYFLCSSLLKCLPRGFEQSFVKQPSFEIAPFQLYMESFTVGDVWIQNLWSENITCLYSVENYDHEPIEIKLIDWSKMSIEKIKNKIKTLVILS
jgi:hypothetical protein